MNCQRKNIRGATLTAIIPMLLGLILAPIFICPQARNKPVSPDEAMYCQGSFEDYKIVQIVQTPRRTGGCWIDLSNGTRCFVFPHTRTNEFHDTMEAMEKGTVLYLAIHPESHYVIEVKTADREILNFEQSQRAIARYSNGYVVLGGVMGLIGLAFLWFICFYWSYRLREHRKALRRARFAEQHPGVDLPPLRPAKETGRCRVFVKDKIEGYEIVYRRRGTVNELVINGSVYDEKRGLLELAHNLSASLDGHIIEAGYDETNLCYIRFDHKRRKRKKRG